MKCTNQTYAESERSVQPLDDLDLVDAHFLSTHVYLVPVHGIGVRRYEHICHPVVILVVVDRVGAKAGQCPAAGRSPPNPRSASLSYFNVRRK